MSKNTSTLGIIKDLMDGINPITKKPLANLSLVQSREAKRVLKQIHDELLYFEQCKIKADKKRRKKQNIEAGKPARSGF